MTDEPLNTSMEAHDGKPEAVVLLLKACMDMINDFPDDMRLNIELDVWEVGARDERVREGREDNANR